MKVILSVRDFAILYNMAVGEISRLEHSATFVSFYDIDRSLVGKKREEAEQKEREKRQKELKSNNFYQDLLRIRDKLGELYVEIETPNVEIKE